MPLPETVKDFVKIRVREYCDQKLAKWSGYDIHLDFKFRGNSVTLYEERPTFFDPSDWVRTVIAQFRYNPKTKEWTLYCADRNSRWHEYIDLLPSTDLDVLLREVDRDPTGIFWG